MDSFPMVVRCFEGQQPEGGSEYYKNECKRCSAVTYCTTSYCALFELQAELGEWEKPPYGGMIWTG